MPRILRSPGSKSFTLEKVSVPNADGARSGAGILGGLRRSPLWVYRVGLATSEALPLYPSKPTFAARIGRSEKCCHKQHQSLPTPCSIAAGRRHHGLLG